MQKQVTSTDMNEHCRTSATKSTAKKKKIAREDGQSVRQSTAAQFNCLIQSPLLNKDSSVVLWSGSSLQKAQKHTNEALHGERSVEEKVLGIITEMMKSVFFPLRR